MHGGNHEVLTVLCSRPLHRRMNIVRNATQHDAVVEGL
jgi:hypothetical protein